MKKFLKITALLLCLTLIVVAFTGCGKKEDTTEDQAVVSEEETTTEKEKEIERGKWEDDVYTNDFANITFKLPEGWEYSNDEEIAEMMNIGTELLNDDQQELAKIAEQTSLYDMVASDPSTGASVMVMFEKTAIKVSTSFYINKLKTGLEQVDSINYSIEDDVTTEVIGGEEYTVLKATVPDYNMVQKYYVKAEGNYFIDILVTYVEGLTEESTIMSSFQ